MFIKWAEARGVPISPTPSPLAIVLYIGERATGSWIPPSPSAKAKLKYGSLQVIPSSIADFWLRHHTADVTDLVENALIMSFLQHLKKRLAISQVAPKRAIPATTSRLKTIIQKLNVMEQSKRVHPLWLLRTRALVLCRDLALRASELVRMRRSWLEWGVADTGRRFLDVTVPSGKREPSPKTIRVWEAENPELCLLRALDAWLDVVTTAFADADAPVFPKLRVERALVANSGRVTVKDRFLSDFPAVAAELFEPDLDPTQIRAGSNVSLRWHCSACDRIWTAKVSNRAARGPCRHRGGIAKIEIPTPEHELTLVDTISTRLEDPGFASDRSSEQRVQVAITRQADDDCSLIQGVFNLAEISARSEFEGVSTNSLRRGCAVELINTGATREDVADHLRHRQPRSSTPYIEDKDLNADSILGGLPGWNDPSSTDESSQ